MYTGKELESKEAKWKRYRLKEKVLYGGVEEGEAFGEKLYLRGEERLNLSLRDPVRRRSKASPLHRGWGEMDQRDSGSRLLEALTGSRGKRLLTRLVALPEEAKGGSER